MIEELIKQATRDMIDLPGGASVEMLSLVNAALHKVREATIEECEGVVKSDIVLAASHSLIYKKRHREITLEDDAVCKCFREETLTRLAALKQKV